MSVAKQANEWRDHPTSSASFIKLGDGNQIYLSVKGPSEYCEVWTAEASLLNADYRQLKFSGLLNGGESRESAKDAAMHAWTLVAAR